MDTIYKIAKTFDKMLKFKMNIKNKTFPDYIPFIKKAFEILFRMTGKYLFYNFSHIVTKDLQNIDIIFRLSILHFIFLEDVQAS